MMLATFDLYGLSWAVAGPVAHELDELRRPPCAPSSATVGLEPGRVRRSGRQVWESGDAMAIVIERSDDATTIALADDVFSITPAAVTYDGPSLARAFDRNFNPLAALLLPYHRMIALHGFVVDLPAGRVAITGETGAGKTTLGRELVARGGVLVADDLVALDQEGRAHPGPPFVRVRDQVEGRTLDAGGKFRVPVEPVPIAARPLDLVVALDPDHAEPVVLRGLDALDLVLSRPYVPVASTPAELLLRLEIVRRATATAIVAALPPRWRSPAELADLVEAQLAR